MTGTTEVQSDGDRNYAVRLPVGHRIRTMTAADLEAVSRVEAASQSYPWKREQFRAELSNPAAAVDLYWINGDLAGFLCSWLVAGELQIQNLATAPHFRRRGVAGRLLEHVLRRSAASGLEAAWLEVRSSNLGAIALYTTLGFRPAGHRRRYYPDGEDAVIMTLQPAEKSAGAEN